MVWCKRWLAAVTSVFILSVMMSVSLTSSAQAQADIGLAAFGDSMDPVRESSEYTYALRLLNYGDQTAENTRLTLPIPKTVEFLAVTPVKQCSYKKASNNVECDFGALKAGVDHHQDIQVMVRLVSKSARSVTLTATARTSSMELVETNNRQSETTTFFGQPSKGMDVGIARLEEVAVKNEDKTRSYDIIVKNFGTIRAQNTKLQVTIPSLLKFKAVTPVDACQFDKQNGRLACELATLEPISKGGENTSVRLTLLDESDTLGAVKLKTIILADGDDAVIANDMQELVVTLGSRLQKPMVFSKRAKADDAPKATAAIDKEPKAEQPTNSDAGASAGVDTGIDGSSGASAGDVSGVSNGTSSSPKKDSSFFATFTNLFSGSGVSAKTAGPSGGDVDFQIQSFETDPDEVPAGSTFTLNTELINNGPGAANNAVLDVTVPEGVAFVSGPAGCVHDGSPATGVSHVNCSFGDIANGGTQSVPILFKAVIPGRVVRTFSAAIDSASDETNPANNSQNVNFTIANGDDLVLEVMGAPNPAVAGGNVTYDLTVNNEGLNIAEGASVTFNLPPGITYVGPGGGGNNGWGCSAAGQVVTCSSGANIAASAGGVHGTITFSIIANIGVGSGTYTASGTVYSTVTPDVEGANDTTTYDLTVQPGTDLSVVKTVSDNPVMGGSTPSFTITVTNNGPITAQNLTLTDVLPDDFGFVSAIGADWSCSNAGQTVTCTRPNMAVGSSDVVITVNAPANNLIPEAGTNIINSATISSDTNDAVAGNDTGSVNFALQRDGADLSISMGNQPTPVAQGSAMTRDIRVTNNGPRVATGTIRVTYEMVAGETFVNAVGSGAGWSCAGPGAGPGTLTCEHAGPLAIDAITSVIHLNLEATGTGTFTNQACTSTQTGLEPVEGDPVASNNCVSRNTNSTANIADLVVSKTAALDPQTTGDATQTYTLTVHNDGPDGAVDVHLTDTITNWVAAYNGRPATTITATTPTGDCIVTAANINCDLNNIANGADAVVTVNVTRPVQGGAAVVNTASAYSWATGDNDRSNNIASVTTEVQFVTDLELRSAVWSPNPVKAGVEATYVLSIRNLGRDVADNVALLSDFGGDFTFISATPSQGTCLAFGANVANRLDCDIGAMGYGNQQTVTIVLRPNHQDPAPAPWEITNSTTVSTSTHETELANNAGGINLDVVPAEIDLDVAETDLVDPVAYNPGVPADNLITYKVTVNNFGPSYATGVNFTDSFTTPAGSHRLKFICDKTAPGDACVEATAGQHCTGQGTIADNAVQESINCIVKKGEADQGEMAADSIYIRYLMFEVLDTPVAGGETHQKNIVISANENDVVPANDNAEEQTTVRIRTDVAVACTAPPASVSIREPFSLTLTVSNNGPGDSQETTLQQTLPTGMVLTAAPSPASGGTCTGNAGSTSFSCDLGNLVNAASNIVTVPVRFASFPAGGSYTTNASVSTNEIDTVAANDSCSTAAAPVTRASIAGFVYEDHNDDGDMDGGETPIAGVTIQITGTDAYGNAVNDTAVTGAAGDYKFWSRSPADAGGYTITETHPAGYADGQENAGGASVVAGSHTTDIISSIALAADEDKVHYDFGELQADLEVVSKIPSIATVSLHQPFDYTIIVRNNGPASATNSALADTLPVGIELTGTPTSVPAKICTGVAGDGSFTCDFGTMAKDDSITVTVPVILANNPGGAASLTNTATASTDRNEITLANNSKSGTVDVVTSSLSCVVFQDLNGAGGMDNGEPGIGGVEVRLTGRDAFGNPVNLVTNTQADGSCQFDNLSPSDADGYTLTETDPVAFNDGNDYVNGNVGVTGNDVFTAIVIAAGVNLPNPYEFGEIPETGLSGTVWCDNNNNGVIDGNEPTRIENVTITLTDENGDAVVDTNGDPIAPATTDANGYYHFGSLKPSAGAGYQLTQSQFSAHSCNLPGQAAVGSVDGNPQGSPDNANASVSFGNVISGIVIAGGGTGVSYNFGELEPATIAGTVFNDTSRDDVRDNGEPGISDVIVRLTCTDYRERDITPLETQTAADGTYSFTNLLPSNAVGCTVTETQPAGYDDGGELVGTINGGTVGTGDDLDAANDNINSIVLASGNAGINYDFAERSAALSGHVYVDGDNDGIFDNGEIPIVGISIDLLDAGNAVVQTVATDVNGYYQFTGLEPGTYSVRETVQPVAWSDGKDTAGTAQGDASVNDIITNIVLVATSFATDYDFGEIGGALSGVVFTDLNPDGQQDGTEPGIPGVTLTLTCTTAAGDDYAVNTTTTDDGSYRFADVPASDAAGCTITETQPPNTTDGLDDVGTLGGTLGNDILSAIPVGPGDEGFGYDFGEILTNPARISGHVWHDGNHDRSNNDGSPEEGWTVELIHDYVCGGPVTIVSTQTTNAAGEYAFEGVSPGTYGIRFRSPDGGYVYAGTQSGDDTGVDIPCGIGTIVVAAGDDVVNQDLPLDPSGVVYDSLTRQPVPGAVVTISCADPAYDPAIHLVGGTNNVSQTTLNNGYYQFLLHAGAPACDYQLSVQPPAGFIPQDSAIIPVCTNTLTVGPAPAPALVQSASTAPTLSAGDHNPASCPTSSAGLAGGAGTTQYYHVFALTPGVSANVVNNHIPLDRVTQGAFTVSKTTPKVNVTIGQLVPYTITVSNNLAANLPNMEIEDQIPPGFKYKRGSASLDGVRSEPVINGRQLTWPGLTFTANQKRVVRLLMIVGSGVSEGEYVNRAWAENGFVQALASNVATAKVRVTPDPTFDCAGVIGKVFDDKNRNGYQDKGEKGLANVRLATVRGLLVTTDKYGRYHVACADVPNADRGSNFIMKLDHRSLPTGYRLTTENPRMIRLTRGKIGKLNFGVAIHRVVRLDVTRDAFTKAGDELKRTWESGISRLVSVLDQGSSILRIAYARTPDEDVRSVRRRIGILKKQVKKLWRRKRRRVLVIETESYLSAKGSFK